jgi:hypothetical protein
MILHLFKKLPGNILKLRNFYFSADLNLAYSEVSVPDRGITIQWYRTSGALLPF